MRKSLALALLTVAGAAFGANEYIARKSSSSGVCAAGAGAESVVCSGSLNSALAMDSVISGGIQNTVRVLGGQSFIGGGTGNFALAPDCVVAGGVQNVCGGVFATIVGGSGNFGTGDGSIVGGNQNVTGGVNSVVAGGLLNTAGGAGSVVPGGAYNSAMGQYSLAAGYKSSATTDGSWVWADFSTTTEYDDHGPNTFSIRASSDVFIDSGSLHVQGAITASTFNAVSSAFQIDGQTVIDSSRNVTTHLIIGGVGGGGDIPATIDMNASGVGGNPASIVIKPAQFSGGSPAGANISIFASTGTGANGSVLLGAGNGSSLNISSNTITLNPQVSFASGLVVISSVCATATTCTATCTTNGTGGFLRRILGGGCAITAGSMLSNTTPNGTTQWQCTTLAATTITTKAICSNLR